MSLFLLFLTCYSQQQQLPVTKHSVRSQGPDGTCPTAQERAVIRENISQQVRNLLDSDVIPVLQGRPPCACGGPGEWTRIAHLDTSDPSQQCPSNWNLTTTPVRGCGRSTSEANVCDSVIFPSNGSSYSRVCGQVNAYQFGSTDALDNTLRGEFTGMGPNPGLEAPHVDGVSLTHGPAGSRQHIWTFIAALTETHSDPEFLDRYFNCACTNINEDWPYEIPSFIGNSYFCDTGNPGPDFEFIYYSDDPLWDGEGCGAVSTCCQLHNPPWFCTTLPQPTTDDIELRICLDQPAVDEDVIISLVDIYVM